MELYILSRGSGDVETPRRRPARARSRPRWQWERGHPARLARAFRPCFETNPIPNNTTRMHHGPPAANLDDGLPTPSAESDPLLPPRASSPLALSLPYRPAAANFD